MPIPSAAYLILQSVQSSILMSTLRMGYVRTSSLRGVLAPRWPGSGKRSSNAKTRLCQTRQHSSRTAEVGSNPEGHSWARRGLAFAGELVVAACTVHCFMEFVAEPYTVAGPSMQPTIEDKSVLLVNKVRPQTNVVLTVPLEGSNGTAAGDVDMDQGCPLTGFL